MASAPKRFASGSIGGTGTQYIPQYCTSAPTEVKELKWEIKDFKTLYDMKDTFNKTYLEFEAGQQIGIPSKWRFYMERKDDNDDIGLFLRLLEHTGPEKEIFAKMGISMRKPQGWTAFSTSNLNTYSIKGNSAWGWRALTSLTKVTALVDGFLVDGALNLHLKVHLFASQAISTIQNELDGPQECQSSLGHDLGKLLDSGNKADVTFLTMDKKKIKAHSAILSARSEVFASMFGTRMTELATGEVILDDITADVLKYILKYIYTDTADPRWIELESFAEVINASEKYALPSLKDFCDRTLGKKCCAENAMDLLNIARLYDLPMATKFIKDFIIKNAKGVLDHI